MSKGLKWIALASCALLACERGESANGPRPRAERASAEAESSPEDASQGEADVEDPETDDAASDTATPAEPEEPPGPPPNYGQLHPSIPPPPEETLTVHGLAAYPVVTVYDEPNDASQKLGYLRLGTRMMVTPKIEGPGCPSGWYGLPQGGFACGKFLEVDPDRPPYLHRTPPPPRLEEPLPYDYGFVRKFNTPMWWKIPSADQYAEAHKQREVLEAERQGLPKPGEEPTVAAAADDAADPSEATPASALPSVDDEPEVANPPEAPDAASGTTGAATPESEESEPEEPINLPLVPDDSWLERGFYVSLAEKETEDSGRSWWRTARGAYVESAAVWEYPAKDFEGQVLAEETTFPFGFAMPRKTARLYELTEKGKLKAKGNLERRQFVDLSEETEVKGKTYMVTADGLLVEKDLLRLADPQPLPEGLEPWEKWIDVSLSKQMLVAYEGETPVYVTLVSSGRKGTPEEPYETPKGRWRVLYKHVSTTMDGPAADGNYSIQDVPWTQYFFGSYALHGAFWHESFGRVRSHGCVNLGPSDARWLFHWTTPVVPEGWHGVFAHEGAPGTTIIVRD